MRNGVILAAVAAVLMSGVAQAEKAPVFKSAGSMGTAEFGAAGFDGSTMRGGSAAAVSATGSRNEQKDDGPESSELYASDKPRVPEGKSRLTKIPGPGRSEISGAPVGALTAEANAKGGGEKNPTGLGAAMGGAAGALILGAVGFVAGGPVGAVIGVAVGGLLGAALGNAKETKSK